MSAMQAQNKGETKQTQISFDSWRHEFLKEYCHRVILSLGPNGAVTARSKVFAAAI